MANTQEDCPICGWAGETVHTAAHTKRCRRWQDAARKLGVTPKTTVQARRAIVDAQEGLETAKSPDKEAAMATLLLRALYDQSLGIAIDEGHSESHPPFETFAAMIKHNNIPESVRDRFPHTPGHIAPGAAVWYPADSRNRRNQFRRHDR